MLGHTWANEANPNLDDPNFQALLARGSEWAATGKVTIPADLGWKPLFNGKNLDDESLFPVYGACERLGLPIFLHPVSPVGTERMRKYHLGNFLGNPYETGIAAASLMFGGVMDEFPDLEVMLPHAGGTFPHLIGRMDHGTTVRAECKHMTKPPSSYLRRFHYDTITHSDSILLNLIRQVGADRGVMGSDCPADMSYTQPVQVIERINELKADERELIVSGNAARLLKVV
jgi:aminocarboxymuconate-semialdehyde decarboxylase